jgi:hypothetical protein
MQVAGAAESIKGIPSPATTNEKNQEHDMAEDIGILQNTIIRAPFSKLPSPTSWEFYSYFWSLIKSKMSALYTRGHFKRCVHKTGISSYMPVDFMKQKDLKNTAKKMYKRYYELLAAYAFSIPILLIIVYSNTLQRRRQISPKYLPGSTHTVPTLSNRRPWPRKNHLDSSQVQVRPHRLAPLLSAR